MPYCNQCAEPVEENDRFCYSCGAAIGGTDKGYIQPELSLKEKAEKRVHNRIELLQHAGVYVIVNVFLVIVWALSGDGYPWFLWVLAPWGVGLAIHAVTYLLSSADDSARHRMIAKEMERMRRKQGSSPAE